MYCKMAQDGCPSSQLLRTYFDCTLMKLNCILALLDIVFLYANKLPASQDYTGLHGK